MTSLHELGQRICVIGPSNSGKSTLATKLGEKLNIPICHLDQLAHIPGTNWIPRDKREFKADQDAFLEKESWIIEGNYSFCMPQRFAKASSLIWIDPSFWGCCFRYLLRCLKNDPNRPGRLKDATSDFSFEMIHLIVFKYPQIRRRHQAILSSYSFPVIYIHSMKELNQYYKRWGLKK
jgi:adenylate kinase family enzyme